MTDMNSSTAKHGATTQPGYMSSEPNPAVPCMLTKPDLEAAKMFVLEYQAYVTRTRKTSLGTHEADMWYCISEIISLIFVWLGYIPHPITPPTADGDKLDKGMEIALEVYGGEDPDHLRDLRPDITKAAFLEHVSDPSMTADLHTYVRAPILPLNCALVRPHVAVHPRASIPHLLRLLQFPFRDAYYSIYHTITVDDTVQALKFLEDLPLNDLCARGIWGRDLRIADQSRIAFCTIVRGWLGLFPAQDIPDSLSDINSYGGESLSDRVIWLKGRAKHSRFIQKVNIWTRDKTVEMVARNRAWFRARA